ncbi:MAG: Photosystem I reaction center subunit IX [Chloroflexaceae bacterium]|nr:Photosystem I reaction center subunit IX [Chloroflexaceae bacterium]
MLSQPFFSYAPLLLFLFLSVQAVLLIVINWVLPDRLFFTLN